MSQFDPYYTWLGIPPEERPADFYRLLGLRRFEDNRDAIANAFDQRMTHLRSLQTGRQAEWSQRLLNELSAAGACLLEENAKAKYDLQLRRREAPPAEPRDASPREIPVIQITDAETKPRRAVDPASSRWLPTMLCSAGAVVLLLGVLQFSRNRSPQPGPANPAAASAELAAAAAGDQDSPQPTVPQPISPDRQSPAAAAAPDNAPGAPRPAPSVNPNPSGIPETGESPPAITPPQPAGPASSAIAPSAPSAPAPAPAPLPSGPGPYALEFANGDGVELRDTDKLINFQRPFTWEAWIRPTRLDRPSLVMGNCILGGHPAAPTGTLGWQVWLLQQDGQLRLAVATGRGFAGTASPEPGWRHLALASDGQQLRMFVDGRVSVQQAVAEISSQLRPSPLPLHLGAHGQLHASQPAGFAGQIGGLRVTASCLYEKNFQPQLQWPVRSDALLHLDFANPQLGEIHDLSPQAHHGVLHGVRWASRIADADQPQPTDLAAADAGPSNVATGQPTGTPPTAVDPPSAAPSAAPAKPAAAKPAAPVGKQLAAAEQRVRQAAEEDFAAAQDAQAKLRLSHKLLMWARRGEDDAATRFALFRLAAMYALPAGGLQTMLPIVDEMEAAFDYDGSALRIEALREATEQLRQPGPRRAFVELALSVVRSSCHSEQFDLALEAARMAQAQASRVSDADLRRRAREGRALVEESKRRHMAAMQAQKRLQDQPDNPALRTVWGLYLIAARGQWQEGLPQLAACDQAELRAAAAADLSPPATAAEQASVADRWWQLATTAQPLEKLAFQQRALLWYERAAPGLEGLAKAQASQRLREGRPAPANAGQAAALLDRVQNAAPELPAGLPAEFAVLLGRLKVAGQDAGVLLRYQNGVRFSDAAVRDLLSQLGPAAPGQALEMMFEGRIQLAETTTLWIRQRGGAAGGGLHTLEIDGRQHSEVGGNGPTAAVHRLTLPRGEHRLRWTLRGPALGACQLQLVSQEGQALPLLHTPAMLSAYRSAPTAKVVNILHP